MPSNRKRELTDVADGRKGPPRKQARVSSSAASHGSVPTSSVALRLGPLTSSAGDPSSQSSSMDRAVFTNPSSQSSYTVSSQRPSFQVIGDEDDLEIIDLTQDDYGPARELYGKIGAFPPEACGACCKLTVPQTARLSVFDTTTAMPPRGRQSSVAASRPIL